MHQQSSMTKGTQNTEDVIKASPTGWTRPRCHQVRKKRLLRRPPAHPVGWRRREPQTPADDPGSVGFPSAGRYRRTEPSSYTNTSCDCCFRSQELVRDCRCSAHRLCVHGKPMGDTEGAGPSADWPNTALSAARRAVFAEIKHISNCRGLKETQAEGEPA